MGSGYGYSFPLGPTTKDYQMKFDRYDGVGELDNGVRMPTDVLDARVSNLCISEVLGRYERFTVDGSEESSYFPWADRFVMGFPLPSWQRPLVWTLEQKVKFIESIWAGVDIGSYMVNDQYEYVGKADKKSFRLNSEILLDGQQRLSAIEGYVTNQFSVPDSTGAPRYWASLPLIERRRFSGFHFARANIKSWDENHLRMAYDLRAFGGTAHTEDQRATEHCSVERQVS